MEMRSQEADRREEERKPRPRLTGEGENLCLSSLGPFSAECHLSPEDNHC